MRSKFFLTSTACVALWSFVGIQTPADAKTRSLYTPASSWSVSHVKDQKGQGNDYCAMAQRFSRDAILTFAKNIHDESSLALDFQKPVLGRKRTLSVTLDPGSGVQRFYEVNPVMSKAFVVRMGQDQEFFSALTRTGFLRVEIDNKSYKFNVSNIDEGHMKLNACLVSNVLPAAGDEGPIESVQEVQDDSGSYRKEINQLRNQLREIQAENQELSGLIKQGAGLATEDSVTSSVSSDGLKDLEARVSELEATNAALKEEALIANKSESELQAEIESLLADNQRIAKQLENLQSNELTTIRSVESQEESDEQITELNSQITRLKEENEGLKAQIEQDKERLVISDEMKAQLTKLEDEKAQLDAQLAILEAQLDTTQTERVAALKAENKKLKQSLEDTQQTGEGFSSILKDQIKSLQAENEVLKQAAIDGVGDETTISNEVVLGLEETILSLKEDVAKKDAELVRLGEQVVDIDQLRNTSAELKARIKTLQESADSHRTEQIQAIALKGRIKDLEAENVRITDNLRAIMGSHDAMKQNADEASSYIKKLKDENTRLSRALETEVLKTEGDLEEELKLLKDVNSELVSQLKDLRKENAENFSIQERNETLEQELAALRAKLDVQDAQASKNDTELQTFRQERDKLLDEAKKHHLTVARAHKELDVLKQENAQLKLEVLSLRDNLRTKASAEQETQSTKARLIELERQNFVLKNQLQHAAAVMQHVQLKHNASMPASEAVSKVTVKDDSKSFEPSAIQNIKPSAGNEKTVNEIVEQIIEDAPEVQAYDDTQDILDGEKFVAKPRVEQVTEAKVSKPDEVEASAQEVIVEQGSNDDDIAPIVSKVEDISREVEDPVAQDVPAQALSEAQKQEQALVSTLHNAEEPTASPVQMDEPLQDEKHMLTSTSVDQISSDDMSSYSIADILDQADLLPADSVEAVEEENTAERRVYQWRLSDAQQQPVYGSAEVNLMSDEQEFDRYVQQYLERTEQRCVGDFAIIPDRTMREGETRIDSYELACVGSSVSAGASLVFFGHEGKFAAVAHEAPAENLDRAMDARDRVLRAVKEGT